MAVSQPGTRAGSASAIRASSSAASRGVRPPARRRRASRGREPPRRRRSRAVQPPGHGGRIRARYSAAQVSGRVVRRAPSGSRARRSSSRARSSRGCPRLPVRSRPPSRAGRLRTPRAPAARRRRRSAGRRCGYGRGWARARAPGPPGAGRGRTGSVRWPPAGRGAGRSGGLPRRTSGARTRRRSGRRPRRPAGASARRTPAVGPTDVPRGSTGAGRRQGRTGLDPALELGSGRQQLPDRREGGGVAVGRAAGAQHPGAACRRLSGDGLQEGGTPRSGGTSEQHQTAGPGTGTVRLGGHQLQGLPAFPQRLEFGTHRCLLS